MKNISSTFSISGKLLKTAEYTKFTMVTDYAVPKLAKLIIHNPLKTGQRTILVYSNWKKQELSSSLFQKKLPQASPLMNLCSAAAYTAVAVCWLLFLPHIRAEDDS